MWCKDNDFYANGKANRIFFADKIKNNPSRGGKDGAKGHKKKAPLIPSEAPNLKMGRSRCRR